MEKLLYTNELIQLAGKVSEWVESDEEYWDYDGDVDDVEEVQVAVEMKYFAFTEKKKVKKARFCATHGEAILGLMEKYSKESRVVKMAQQIKDSYEDSKKTDLTEGLKEARKLVGKLD